MKAMKAMKAGIVVGACTFYQGAASKAPNPENTSGFLPVTFVRWTSVTLFGTLLCPEEGLKLSTDSSIAVAGHASNVPLDLLTGHEGDESHEGARPCFISVIKFGLH